MIVVDPRPQADITRGQVIDELVEAIDLAPTFLEALGLPPVPHCLEGQSLQALMHGQHTGPLRQAVFSENTYAFRDPVRLPLGRPVEACQMTMVRTRDWKLVHHEGLPPQLFDLQKDPDECHDLGTDPALAGVRAELMALLFEWLQSRRRNTTITHESIALWNRREVEAGIRIGEW